MKTVYPRFKDKPIRLSKAKMKILNGDVLSRDNHQCQNPYCEDGMPLDIPHHVKFKSQGGGDIAINLITLCCSSHRMVHHTGKLKISGEYPNWTFEFNKKNAV